MPELIDFHALFCQLQARYPTSSLITELAHVQEGSFTVRAIAHISGVPLASSLATAATVEQAEDQARLRLLRLLGVPLGTPAAVQPAGIPMTPVLPPMTAPFQSSGYESQAQLLTDPLDIGQLLAARSPISASAAAAAPSPATEPVNPPLPSPPSAEFAEPLPLSFEFDDFEEGDGPPPLKPVYAFGSSATTQQAESAEIPAATPPEVPAATPTAKSRSTKSKATTAATPVAEPKTMAEPNAIAEPMSLPVLDLTPVFLQIADEMERIGWTKTQGREYLKTAYGKQTRAELTDDELTDFLNHLKNCPVLVNTDD
jgi:hypothetical protein